MEEELKQLKKQVAELLEWKRQKELQQIDFPLDQASRSVIGGAQDEGAGESSLTQVVEVASAPTNINVPAAYSGTRLIVIGGVRYEIPYLSIS